MSGCGEQLSHLFGCKIGRSLLSLIGLPHQGNETISHLFAIFVGRLQGRVCPYLLQAPMLLREADIVIRRGHAFPFRRQPCREHTPYDLLVVGADDVLGQHAELRAEGIGLFT